MKSMKRQLLLIIMLALTLLAASTVWATAAAFRNQEAAMESVMRAYVTDLAESVLRTSDSGQWGPGRGRRAGYMNMMHMNMLHHRFPSTAPRNSDAGGILIAAADGDILAASPEAEKLLPLRDQLVPEEPKEVQTPDGRVFYAVLRKMRDGGFVLSAISRSILLGPMYEEGRARTLHALITSAAVLVGMIGLWLALVAPLHRIVYEIRNMRWGRDRPEPSRPVLFEVAALVDAIGELADRAIAREELKTRYVNDLVQIQEEAKKRLSRELHDGSLQGVVAAVKRIQLARESAMRLEKLPGKTSVEISENLREAEDVAQRAAGEIRDYCDELSPSWVRLGLSGAMYENADRLSRAFGLTVDIEGAEEAERGAALPEEHVLALVRILQEAVSNSARHGAAQHAVASFRREEGMLVFSIRDDGRGFSPYDSGNDADFALLRTSGHRGLANINERARLLGGSLSIISAPGEGCLLQIRAGESTENAQRQA